MFDIPITRRTSSANANELDRLDAAPAGIALSRRQETRRSNRLAWLVVEGQTQRFHANMRHYHTEGADLTVSGLMGIPDRFLLYVEPDSIRYECSVRERRGNMVGVRFLSRTENVRYRDDLRQS